MGAGMHSPGNSPPGSRKRGEQLNIIREELRVCNSIRRTAKPLRGTRHAAPPRSIWPERLRPPSSFREPSHRAFASRLAWPSHRLAFASRLRLLPRAPRVRVFGRSCRRPGVPAVLRAAPLCLLSLPPACLLPFPPVFCPAAPSLPAGAAEFLSLAPVPMSALRCLSPLSSPSPLVRPALVQRSAPLATHLACLLPFFASLRCVFSNGAGASGLVLRCCRAAAVRLSAVRMCMCVSCLPVPSMGRSGVLSVVCAPFLSWAGRAGVFPFLVWCLGPAGAVG